MTANDAIVALTVRLTTKPCPNTTATVLVAVPKTLPVPFAPSYNVIVIVGLPAGALIGIAQLRPFAATVHNGDVAERSAVVVARSVTAIVPDSTDGETKRGRRIDAGTLVPVGMKIVAVPFDVDDDAGVRDALDDEPPPHPLATNAMTATRAPSCRNVMRCIIVSAGTAD